MCVLAAACLFLSFTAAVKDGICILYASDVTRSFYFSGVTPAGGMHPQLLDFANWDALRAGLDSGADEDVMYIVPEGLGPDGNMTIATVRTSANGTASVSYADLGEVPGFEGVAPYTFMPVMHLDAKRGQMIAALEGVSGPPPVMAATAARRRAPRRRPSAPLRVSDGGDLFLVIADVIPSNGTVSRVWLDLTEQDTRWGESSVLSGVSAFDGDLFWLNPVGGNVPTFQALYGFPINGSAATVVPYGNQLNIAHLFFSQAQASLLAILSEGSSSTLARVSPPSPDFARIFTWNFTANEQDWGTYDVSADGSKLLSVVVDKNGENPVLSIVDLVLLKEITRIRIQGFVSSDTVLDVNWCNVN